MKITHAEIVVCSPSRNFVTLLIHTDEGLTGIGDATLNGRELAVSSYLEDYCLPCLVGRDPFDTENIWQYFYRGAYWKRGPVTMTAIGAIDMALWDIKGKALQTPVYNLLGGRSREGIRVYCHVNGKDTSQTVEEVHRFLALGYKAIRVQSGIPGIAETYGVSGQKLNYEPATRGLPHETIWNTQKYLAFIPSLFHKIREQFGTEIDLLHDCHHRLTPIEAARLGKELEPCHLFWMEDPVSEENQESFRIIRQHTTTPIAVGEIFNTVFDCHQLITGQLIDYLRMTIVHGGGITALQKVAHLAEVYGIRIGFHGATDLSPVTMASALHLNSAINNFGIQEYMKHESIVDEVFPHEYYYKDGDMHIGNKPGLGVEFDRALAKQFPYQRAYLPVNRLEDGTMWNW